MRRNWNWIGPLLAIGGRIPEELNCRWELLGEGISRVIDLRDLRAETQPEWLPGVELLHLPTPDHQPISQSMIWQGVQWTRKAWEANLRVLIHCEHGIGRCALLAACVLVSEGASPTEAIRELKQVRSCIAPSPVQLHALLAWAASWNQSQGKPPSTDTWAALSRIAYLGITSVNRP
ncbi:MAG TPA: protein phosphatase [Bdellovibrionales bacterium]|nr:MAG: hypothetical protein A2Z97_15620 [Bdellovibrionales bacterium GWB1_52_6]OFZ02919.1 MAG: hypothetical protein A2X97_04925 [Bdellovibrionales bacterium GWA1_52_35]OFZ40816.1 MAG: hypothetical protein A2070_13685 [Bdellovibrionales bacterium GWC1_52_8]HAR42826.1 protein phosphatase [Bdellovibrionales bacterium]HCM38502.1 protein phosphatase [Bdellovibrionales bacterium]